MVGKHFRYLAPTLLRGSSAERHHSSRRLPSVFVTVDWPLTMSGGLFVLPTTT